MLTLIVPALNLMYVDPGGSLCLIFFQYVSLLHMQHAGAPPIPMHLGLTTYNLLVNKMKSKKEGRIF